MKSNLIFWLLSILFFLLVGCNGRGKLTKMSLYAFGPSSQEKYEYTVSDSILTNKTYNFYGGDSLPPISAYSMTLRKQVATFIKLIPDDIVNSNSGSQIGKDMISFDNTCATIGFYYNNGGDIQIKLCSLTESESEKEKYKKFYTDFYDLLGAIEHETDSLYKVYHLKYKTLPSEN